MLSDIFITNNANTLLNSNTFIINGQASFEVLDYIKMKYNNGKIIMIEYILKMDVIIVNGNINKKLIDFVTIQCFTNIKQNNISKYLIDTIITLQKNNHINLDLINAVINNSSKTSWIINKDLIDDPMVIEKN